MSERTSPQSVLSSHLGELDEHPEGYAYCACPGASLHSSPTGKRDCRVYFQSGAPTIFCLHDSCAGAVEAMNKTIRSSLGKLAASGKATPVRFLKSPAQCAREREQQMIEQLATKARAMLPKILAAYPWPPDQIFTDSPEGVAGDPEEDWRLVLSLFQAEETIWIGDKKESGYVRHISHFLTAAEWQKRGACPTGPFILPAALNPGSCSRKKTDIARLPFLVVESDTLGKSEIGAVFRWMREAVGMKLVAVVDTARWSLHGWFIRPDDQTMRDLEPALKAMGCDGKVLRNSQPVRLPGCLRPGQSAVQALLYLNRGIL